MPGSFGFSVGRFNATQSLRLFLVFVVFFVAQGNKQVGFHGNIAFWREKRKTHVVKCACFVDLK